MRLRRSSRGSRRVVSDRQRTKWWDAFTAAWNSMAVVVADRYLTASKLSRSWCSNCLAYGPGIRPRHLDGRLVLFCERCDERDAASNPNGPDDRRGKPRVERCLRSKYWPLDESERDLSFRILRTLARFDWLTTTEMRELMGIAGLENKTENNTFAKRVSVLARDGFLRRRDTMEMPEYQITNLGRSRIDNWMQAAVENKRSIAA